MGTVLSKLKKILDITGRKFGHLLVLRANSRKVDENGRLLPITWRCLCENCGNEVDIPGTQLRNSSNRTSCGCIKKQQHAPAIKNKDLVNIIKSGYDNETREPEQYGRKWGPCPFPSWSCRLSKAGWCCHDCRVKNCLDRCLNTPGEDEKRHCGCGRLKKK